MVGCRANEIENLLTAEPRVVSEKEKNRYLKFVTATKRGTFLKRKVRRKKDEKVLELSGMQKGPRKMAKIQIEVKKKKIWIVGNYKICDEVYENKQNKLVILAYKVMSG